MYKNINYNEHLDVVLKQMPKGIFMTVNTNNELNTMVLGWGNIGFLWGKKIFTAYVRYSRHTYKLLESAKEFTISVPIHKDLKKEISFCGRVSGRDVNKFEQCHLTPIDSRTIKTPIIGECELHYECKVIYQQALEPSLIPTDVKKRYYEDNDFHVVYYGEIVDSYMYENN